MPCETCHVQFTVFRRKRICYDCRCFFCSNCLTANRRNIFLCQRCAIFAKRPLLRSDLLQLKPKDLIFYLQSKHISTAGCVEKEELVGLILTHVEQMGDTCTSNGPSSPNDDTSHSFDSLKQTCQNFFSNISDNISDSFATFESKPTMKSTYRQNYRRTSGDNNNPMHIFEQPRVSTRELPTYASFQNTQLPRTQPTANNTSSLNRDSSGNVKVNNANNVNLGASAASPTTSTSAHQQSTAPTRSPNSHTTNVAVPKARQQVDYEKSDCECSDDEIVTTFNERLSVKTQASGQMSSSRLTVENLTCQGPSTTTSTSPGYSKQDSISSKVDICGIEVSSHSSFEELGAIGGISDESKATTDTNSSCNTDQWQMLDAQNPETSVADDKQAATESSTNEVHKVTDFAQQINQNTHETQQAQMQLPIVPQRTKKVIRRRSEGYLNRHNHSSDDESPVGVHNINLATLREYSEAPESTIRSSCQRCGKNRATIKRQVDRLRRHLESSQMSEEDIKHEIKEFLSYLEQRTKSIDCSDQESHVVSSLSDGGIENSSVAGGIHTVSPTLEFSPSIDFVHHLNDNDGIHVYAASDDYEAAGAGIDSRFINLDDFDDLKELENLTVKQLKEVLMLHRVDYKGCCEKQELLDRASRLWKTLRAAPAVEKLATDELCKICMDAPIECVFLECGHMATCTNCGKVLNECPICRQYIVRVVRFFRA